MYVYGITQFVRCCVLQLLLSPMFSPSCSVKSAPSQAPGRNFSSLMTFLLSPTPFKTLPFISVIVIVQKWECLGEYINQLSISVHKWDIPSPSRPYPPDSRCHLPSLLGRRCGGFSFPLTFIPIFSRIGMEWGGEDAERRQRRNSYLICTLCY